MFGEVASSKWLTWQLFKRNFNALYRQSLLGIAWVLIAPLISVGTFIFLNASGIINVGDISVPYPLFAMAGIALWSLFSMGLTLSSNALVGASSMITKINFTREPLVISAIFQGIVPSLIQIVVVFVLFAWYQVMPPLTVLLAPLAAIPLLVLTLGLGFLLSLINAVMRDVGNVISIVVTFLLFLTPVLYAKPVSGISAVVSRYNPLYYLVAVPRDLVTSGGTAEWQGYLYSTLFSIVVLFIGWLAFHLTETRIAERV